MRPLIIREDANKYCCVSRLPLINRLKVMKLCCNIQKAFCHSLKYFDQCKKGKYEQDF